MSELTIRMCSALSEIFPEASFRQIRAGVAAVAQEMTDVNVMPVSGAAWDHGLDFDKLGSAVAQIMGEVAGRVS